MPQTGLFHFHSPGGMTILSIGYLFILTAVDRKCAVKKFKCSLYKKSRDVLGRIDKMNVLELRFASSVLNYSTFSTV